jgi:hypothetical protein
MARVVGQLWRTRHVRPLQPCALRSRHAEPRLVVVQYGCLAQPRLDLVFDAAQPLGSYPHQMDQRAHRERRAEDIGEELPDPRIRHELLLHQVRAQRAQPGAILLRSAQPHTPDSAHAGCGAR